MHRAALQIFMVPVFHYIAPIYKLIHYSVRIVWISLVQAMYRNIAFYYLLLSITISTLYVGTPNGNSIKINDPANNTVTSSGEQAGYLYIQQIQVHHHIGLLFSPSSKNPCNTGSFFTANSWQSPLMTSDITPLKIK